MALPVRIALAVVALAAAAWLGIQAVGAHASAQLTDIAFAPGKISGPEQQHAASLLDQAERLNPDTRPELFRGVLRLRANDVAGAERIFEAVTKKEPENLEAWALIARTATGYDPELAARARSRLRVLAPPVSR